MRASRAKIHKLADRDGWNCWLCGVPIDPYNWADANRASLDHVVPKSEGGTNALTNLRLAHTYCNSIRADRTDWP